jgi:hypothetical protein
VGRILDDAIRSLDSDRAIVSKWRLLRVGDDTLFRWADTHVYEAFGPKAAVRVLGIALDGCDAEPEGELGNHRPSEVRRRKLSPVPGIDAPVRDVFGVSQVLAWLAGQRAELSEDLQWRAVVPDLIEKLVEEVR